MLITADYARLNAQLHESRPDYGTSGRQWSSLVRDLANQCNAVDILDYGCGKQTLAAKLVDLKVIGYDPAIQGLDAPPRPADLVVCTDVLEHVEPDCIDAVLDDICRVARHAAFVTVATRPAVKVLADGRNAHLTVQPYAWWRERFLERFDIVDVHEIEGHEFALVLRSVSVEPETLPSFRIASYLGTVDVNIAGATNALAVSAAANPVVSVVKFESHRLQFQTPNKMTRWRVETLFSKEPGTIAWLRGMSAGETMVDVGANVGMYTIFAAAVKGVRVAAFEPESQNYALLNSNIALNDLASLVTAYPLALSDARGAQLLHLSELTPGGSCHSLGEEVGFDLKPRASAYRQGSYGVTLDELVESGTIEVPTHLKIDVDGFEHKVLTGARKTLADPRLKSVLVELNTHLPEHQAAMKALQDAGLGYDEAQVASALRKSGAFEGVGEFIFRRTLADTARLNRPHSWSPPLSPRGRSVMRHVIGRVHETPVERSPFPYLVVDNVFPPDYYQEMLRQFPAETVMRTLAETGRVEPGNYEERRVTLFDADGFSRLSPDQREFWGELSDWLHDAQLLHAFTAKFGEFLEPRIEHIVAAEGALRTRGDALLVHDCTRYAIGPHTDAPHRLVTFLFYLPDDEGLRELGTSIYTPKDPSFTCWGGPHHARDNFHRVDTVEFLPNRLLAFPKTERSFHGVEPIEREDVQRRLLINNIRLLNRTTH